MGGWSYYKPEFKVKQGDTIYFWVYVIVDHLSYQGLGRSYNVTGECLFYYYDLI